MMRRGSTAASTSGKAANKSTMGGRGITASSVRPAARPMVQIIFSIETIIFQLILLQLVLF